MKVREFMKSGLFKKGNDLYIKTIQKDNGLSKLITVESCTANTGYHSIVQNALIMGSEITLLLQSESRTYLHIK